MVDTFTTQAESMGVNTFADPETDAGAPAEEVGTVSCIGNASLRICAVRK